MMRYSKTVMVSVLGAISMAAVCLFFMLFAVLFSENAARWSVREMLRQFNAQGDFHVEVAQVSGRLGTGVSFDDIRIVDAQGVLRFTVMRMDVSVLAPALLGIGLFLDELRIQSPTIHLYGDGVERVKGPSSIHSPTARPASFLPNRFFANVRIRNLTVIRHELHGTTVQLEGGRADTGIQIENSVLRMPAVTFEATLPQLRTKIKMGRLTGRDPVCRFSIERAILEGTVEFGGLLISELPMLSGDKKRQTSSLAGISRFNNSKVSAAIIWSHENLPPVRVRTRGTIYPELAVKGDVAIGDQNRIAFQEPIGNFQIKGTAFQHAEASAALSFIGDEPDDGPRLMVNVSAGLSDGNGSVTSQAALANATFFGEIHVSGGSINYISFRIAARDWSKNLSHFNLTPSLYFLRRTNDINGEIGCNRYRGLLECTGRLALDTVESRFFKSEDILISTSFAFKALPFNMQLHHFKVSSKTLAFSIVQPAEIRAGKGRLMLNDISLQIDRTAVPFLRRGRIGLDVQYENPNLSLQLSLEGENIPSTVPPSLKAVTGILGGWRGRTVLSASKNRLQLDLNQVAIGKLIGMVNGTS